MTRVNQDTVVAIVLLIGCGIFLSASFDIREPDYGQLSPAAWPRVVVGILTFLSALLLIQSVRRGAADSPEERGETAEKAPSGIIPWLLYWRNVFWVFALFLCYFLTMP